MSNLNEAVDITAQCLCKEHSFRATVPRSSLPLKASCCHCTSCRRTTGAMYSSDAPWPGDAAEVQRSALKSYVFSPRVTVRFCGTCSSPVFFEESPDGPDTPAEKKEYAVFTGVLSNNTLPGMLKIQDHIFVGDTRDGGASMWLRKPNGDDVAATRWLGARDQSEQPPYDWPRTESLPAAHFRSEVAEIPIRCRCQGVDLVFRVAEANAEYSGKGKAELPWFVDPATKKFLVGFDACNSCRIQSGTDLFHWTFALLRHVGFPGPAASSGSLNGFPADSDELRAAVSAGDNRDPRFGTLAFYASSNDVQRYFCARCSACVFYCVDDRKDTVDIAMGVLSSPDGARAEGTCAWALGGKAFWRDDMLGGWRESLLEAVEAEAEAWRIERGYPKGWKRQEREEAEKVA